MNIYFFFLLLLSFSPAIFSLFHSFSLSLSVSLSLSNFSLESFKEKPFEKIGEPRSKKKRKKSLSSMFAFGVMRFSMRGPSFFFSSSSSNRSRINDFSRFNWPHDATTPSIGVGVIKKYFDRSFLTRFSLDFS